jgi:lipoprotein signal peptidase
VEAPPQTPTPPLRPLPSGWLWAFAGPLLAVAVVDLASKSYLFSRYSEGDDLAWWCELAWNPGVAWGIGGSAPTIVLALTLVLIPVLVAVWWFGYRRESRWANIAFGLIMGGAVGNAHDRVMTALVGEAGGYKGVRDFIRIDLRLLRIDYTWPNFNVADSAITIGFVLLLLLPWISRSPRQRTLT